MNIVPNATIVVQIIHFGIAYTMITQLLCKPMMDEYEDQEKALELLHARIAKAHSETKNLLEKRYAHWYQAHLFFVKHKPVCIAYRIQQVQPLFIDSLYPSRDALTALASEVSQAVLRKVVYDGK